MSRNDFSEAPVFVDSSLPNRRRLLWAAVTGSGMLTGIYWTFPPIFAEAEPVEASIARVDPLVRTVSLDTLPDLVLTPSIQAHRKSIAMLEEGIRKFETVSGYKAEFSKQELVSGEMTDPQTMALKVRHEPFSVYMKWIEGKPGQELLYVEGENDGEMIVRPGGLKGRFLGAIRLSPTGGLAMSEARHPVTQVGLLHLAEKILTYRYNESHWTSGYTCIEQRVELHGRPALRFTIEYDSPSYRADYRKSIVWIDEELSLATKVENYGWPAGNVPPNRLDAETLIESYAYRNIDLDTQLAAVDFNAANEAYGLRRR